MDKAITIMQPYAELIVRGEKRVENRRRRVPGLSGLVWIHAGKSRDWLRLVDSGEYDANYDLPVADMGFGAIVGRAQFVASFELDECVAGRIPAAVLRRWPRLAGHPHVEGPVCHVMESIERLERPIPCRGQQGVFRVDVAELEAASGIPVVLLPALTPSP